MQVDSARWIEASTAMNPSPKTFSHPAMSRLTSAVTVPAQMSQLGPSFRYATKWKGRSLAAQKSVCLAYATSTTGTLRVVNSAQTRSRSLERRGVLAGSGVGFPSAVAR